MEIESKNGSKIRVQQNLELGRGELGFDSSDRTVSRRHVSFNIQQHEHDDDDGSRVCFQVKGKNPIWVRDSITHNITLYKRSQQGHLKIGDSFCVSSKDPLWFHLNTIPSEEEDESSRYQEAFAGDISGFDHHQQIETALIPDIDPVKEFNFVVMGHEFDCYSKKLIRDIRNWNWFLEEPNEDSDEEGDKKSRKKRKKGGTRGDDDDDIWTGESEEDVELVKKLRNDPKPKYSTRSKDKGRKGAGAGTSKSAKDDAKRKATSNEVEEEEDDEGEETLGGFIVDDEDIGEGDEEEDEEEEFEEDEDDE